MQRIVKAGVRLAGLVALLAGAGVWYAAQPALNARVLPPDGVRTLFPARPATPPPPGGLRLVTYNIGYASGRWNNRGGLLPRDTVRDHLAAMVTALRPQRPDIVALQEVDLAARRTTYLDQMAYLAAALDLPHAAYVVTWNRRYLPWPYWPPHRHYGQVVSGQVVLSRYPIEDHLVHRFPKPADRPVWYNWFYLDRVAQQVAVRVGARRVTVWNVHLEAFDESARADQLRTLAGLIAAAPRPAWVLGDFNEERLGPFLAVTGLIDTHAADPRPTFPSWGPVQRIDYLLHHPGITPTQRGRIIDLPASDHLPLWATE